MTSLQINLGSLGSRTLGLLWTSYSPQLQHCFAMNPQKCFIDFWVNCSFREELVRAEDYKRLERSELDLCNLALICT